jgi:hypothetical protein
LASGVRRRMQRQFREIGNRKIGCADLIAIDKSIRARLIPGRVGGAGAIVE